MPLENPTPGMTPHNYFLWERHAIQAVIKAHVIEESLVTVYVNGQELATLMCSPVDRDFLALGFLYNEGIIESYDDVRLVKPNLSGSTIDIFVQQVEFTPPRKLILTSGCGGGVTLHQLTLARPALNSAFATTPETLFKHMRDLKNAGRLYNQVRGVHTSILCNVEQLLFSAEDVGRHNTLDKIAGKALQAGVITRDHMLLTSGRISSEMLNKARRMEVPLIASRTSPTSLALEMAQAWNICVAGYVRNESMRVYTHPYRLGLEAIPHHTHNLPAEV